MDNKTIGSIILTDPSLKMTNASREDIKMMIAKDDTLALRKDLFYYARHSKTLRATLVRRSDFPDSLKKFVVSNTCGKQFLGFIVGILVIACVVVAQCIYGDMPSINTTIVTHNPLPSCDMKYVGLAIGGIIVAIIATVIVCYLISAIARLCARSDSHGARVARGWIRAILLILVLLGFCFGMSVLF